MYMKDYRQNQQNVEYKVKDKQKGETPKEIDKHAANRDSPEDKERQRHPSHKKRPTPPPKKESRSGCPKEAQ